MSFRFLYLLIAAGMAVSGDLASAAEQNSAEAKLREQLRNALLQLRNIQTERDTAQAEKTQLEQDKKSLGEKVDALAKQLAADKDASDKTIVDLRTKTEGQAAEIARLNESLEKWKASQKQAAALAEAKEAERAKLLVQNVELQRVVADQQRRNTAMYKVGSEILSRYEKFGLGTAIAAREPFVGTMRVKLENLVQDYSDKLSEQRIRPEAAVTAVQGQQPPPPQGAAVTTAASAAPAAEKKPEPATAKKAEPTPAKKKK